MLVETKARVGVFAIALGAYLPQFPSLVPEFAGQYDDFKTRIPGSVELIDGGIVTTKEQAMAAGDKFRAADVDLVILQLLTYATSYNMLPAVRDLDVPVVLVYMLAVSSGIWPEEMLPFCTPPDMMLIRDPPVLNASTEIVVGSADMDTDVSAMQPLNALPESDAREGASTVWRPMENALLAEMVVSFGAVTASILSRSLNTVPLRVTMSGMIRYLALPHVDFMEAL